MITNKGQEMMAIRTSITRIRPHKNVKMQQIISEIDYWHRSRWPRYIIEAYNRYPGLYTAGNVGFLLEEEPLELFNGW